jgi:hypothetical protein
MFRVKVELHPSTALPTTCIGKRLEQPRCANNANFNVNFNVNNGKIVNSAFTLQCLWVKERPEIR